MILIRAALFKISPALIEQIARETGLKLVGWPFSEALSERGGSATIYVVIFEYNLGAIMTVEDDMIKGLLEQVRGEPDPSPESIHEQETQEVLQ